jgi:hypothetical protein
VLTRWLLLLSAAYGVADLARGRPQAGRGIAQISLRLP